VSVWTIYRALRVAGANRPRRPAKTAGQRGKRTASEYAARYRELPNELSYMEKVRRIRLEFRVYPNAVRNALKRMGITPANPS